MDRDLQNLITSDDIKKFNRSQPALHAVKLLGNAVAGQNVPLSKEEYTTVRNYLLSEIILHNANRPGVLANMQVKDIRDAQMIKDHYVVSVSDRKTSSVHGPAKVVIQKTIYNRLMIFVDKVCGGRRACAMTLRAHCFGKLLFQLSIKSARQ